MNEDSIHYKLGHIEALLEEVKGDNEQTNKRLDNLENRARQARTEFWLALAGFGALVASISAWLR